MRFGFVAARLWLARRAARRCRAPSIGNIIAMLAARRALARYLALRPAAAALGQDRPRLPAPAPRRMSAPPPLRFLRAGARRLDRHPRRDPAAGLVRTAAGADARGRRTAPQRRHRPPDARRRRAVAGAAAASARARSAVCRRTPRRLVARRRGHRPCDGRRPRPRPRDDPGRRSLPLPRRRRTDAASAAASPRRLPCAGRAPSRRAAGPARPGCWSGDDGGGRRSRPAARSAAARPARGSLYRLERRRSALSARLYLAAAAGRAAPRRPPGIDWQPVARAARPPARRAAAGARAATAAPPSRSPLYGGASRDAAGAACGSTPMARRHRRLRSRDLFVDGAARLAAPHRPGRARRRRLGRGPARRRAARCRAAASPGGCRSPAPRSAPAGRLALPHRRRCRARLRPGAHPRRRFLSARAPSARAAIPG